MPPFVPSQFFPLLIRIGIAFLIGALIGFEREMRGNTAGLRTHILVCLGAALLSIVDSSSTWIQGKLAAQIITSVGFLGAGSILHSDRGSVPVHGLTTAASLWCTAAIGIAVGWGGVNIWTALAASVIVFITLTVVGMIEGYALDKQRDRNVNITIHATDDPVASQIMDAITALGIGILGVRTDQPDSDAGTKILHLRVHMNDRQDIASINKILSATADVTAFDWV